MNATHRLSAVLLTLAVALAPKNAHADARTEVDRKFFGAGLAVEVQTRARFSDAAQHDALAMTLYRPTLTVSLVVRARGKRLFVVPLEVSGTRASRTLAASQLRLDQTAVWACAGLERRWLVHAAFAPHLRLRLGVGPTKLQVTDWATHAVARDWKAHAEVALLAGFRVLSLLVLETGLALEVRRRMFELEGTSFSTPRVGFRPLARLGLEYRF